MLGVVSICCCSTCGCARGGFAAGVVAVFTASRVWWYGVCPENGRAGVCLFVCCLLNVPATC